jgi:lipopolysaccharide transport system ATP-binding protein
VTNNLIAISVRNLTKVYPSDLTPLSVALFFLGLKKGRVIFKDLSFDIVSGKVVGLIGSNGAGKSTLLRILAGKSAATKGNVYVKGSVLAILQIATGLQDELTGRENIQLLGAMYGLTRSEIESRIDSIIEFSQLINSIDNPIRTYSAGMRSRLAFSIVTSVDFDILIIDEALSVGDVGFAQRCRERMRSLCRLGKTVIIVSHSMPAMRELCDIVMWLENGKIHNNNIPSQVIEAYRLSMLMRAEIEFSRQYANRNRNVKIISEVEILSLLFSDKSRENAKVLLVGKPVLIESHVYSLYDEAFINMVLKITRVDGALVAIEKVNNIKLKKGRNRVEINMDELRLGRYAYECALILKNTAGSIIAERVTIFSVEENGCSYNPGYFQQVGWREINTSISQQ